KTFSWVGAVSVIDRDEEQFGRNPNLQSSCSWEDRFAQLFPMGYSDYLKKMRKYVLISHLDMLFLLMWLH
ncbi:hypothetical protein VIGAN_07098700, partial [Vigna angularis var. angularis]